MHIFRVTYYVPFLRGVILTCTVADDIISVSDVRRKSHFQAAFRAFGDLFRLFWDRAVH